MPIEVEGEVSFTKIHFTYHRLDSRLHLPPIVCLSMSLGSFAFSSTPGFLSEKQGSATFLWEHFIENMLPKILRRLMVSWWFVLGVLGHDPLWGWG